MHALGRIPETALPRQESPSPAPWLPPSAPSGEKGSGAALALKTPEGTFTSIINPDLINAPEPIDRKGFWITPRYSYEFRGMDIGDVNGDGLNETVVSPRRRFTSSAAGQGSRFSQDHRGEVNTAIT
jgi:hypothetical protein